MANINKVYLAGHLGRDPELRFTTGGKAVCEFTIAINTKFGQVDETAWVRITCWGAWAEAAGKFKKGEAVFVEGRLRTESWESKKEKGKMESRTAVTASTVYLMPRGEASEAPARAAQRELPVEPAAPEAEDDVPF